MRSRLDILVFGWTAFHACGVGWRVIEASTEVGCPRSLLDPSVAMKVTWHLLDSVLSTLLLCGLVVGTCLSTFVVAKRSFLGGLTLSESRKLAERLLNYGVSKAVFLAAVVDPGHVTEVAIWLVWFSLVGMVKMLSCMAKDRSQGLVSSPSATWAMHLRTYLLLVLTLVQDFTWGGWAVLLFHRAGWNWVLLLLFEPAVVALDTFHGLAAYTIQLLELRAAEREEAAARAGAEGAEGDGGPADAGGGGGGREWGAGTALYYLTAAAESSHLTLTLAHYSHVWWLHGMSFKLVDAILFLNIKALSSDLRRRARSFLAFRAATRNLHRSFPEATPEQIAAFDDECAICKDTLTTAKRLPCGHLFHLPCLRSWLERGASEDYSCPTCRCSLAGAAGGVAAAAQPPPAPAPAVTSPASPQPLGPSSPPPPASPEGGPFHPASDAGLWGGLGGPLWTYPAVGGDDGGGSDGGGEGELPGVAQGGAGAEEEAGWLPHHSFVPSRVLRGGAGGGPSGGGQSLRQRHSATAGAGLGAAAAAAAAARDWWAGVGGEGAAASDRDHHHHHHHHPHHSHHHPHHLGRSTGGSGAGGRARGVAGRSHVGGVASGLAGLGLGAGSLPAAPAASGNAHGFLGGHLAGLAQGWAQLPDMLPEIPMPDLGNFNLPAFPGVQLPWAPPGAAGGGDGHRAGSGGRGVGGGGPGNEWWRLGGLVGGPLPTARPQPPRREAGSGSGSRQEPGS